VVSGSSFNNAYGPAPIVPVNPSFEALTIAANTFLNWPQETTGGAPYVAAQINVTASATGLLLVMPPGDTGSTGPQTIITNVGTNTFTVVDQEGNQIAVIATTQSWLITLIDNTTNNGSWQALQMASTVSEAVASGLAGPGLQASGSQLQTVLNTVYLSANTLITAGYRAEAVIWDGMGGTLTFDASTNLTSGWYCAVSNGGTQPITLSTTGGDTIDGQGSITLAPGDGGLVVCTTGGFNTIGALITPLSLAGGGTGATTAAQALVNLGGTSVGISMFTAPSVAAVVAILGLTNTNFSESTVATNQVLAAGSSNTIFVCTAAISLTFPLTTTVTKQFVVIVNAFGGAVTLAPQASDTFNGGTAGAVITIPEGTSCLVCTDANGNLYTVFGTPTSISTANLTVTGTTLLEGAVTANSSLSVAGALTANGGTTLGGGLNVSSGNLTVAGAAFVGTGLTIYADGLAMNGSLSVNGNGNLSGGLAVGDGINETGVGINTDQSLSAGQNLTVGGTTTLQGDVTINGGGIAALSVLNGGSQFYSIETTGAQGATVAGYAYTPGGPGAFSGSVDCGLLCSGSAVVASNIYASSDGRLKFDIEVISVDRAWAWVVGSVPVQYKKRPFYNSPDDKAVIEAGFIAQDQIRLGFGEFAAPAPSKGMPKLHEDDITLAADFMLSLPLNYQIAFLTAALKDEREQRLKLEIRVAALEESR
jgi:filamentous hemagglutinin